MGGEAAVSFVANSEHFEVGVEFAGSGFDKVFAITSTFMEVAGDGADFDVGFWFKVGRFGEGFFDRIEGEFEEEVGHDQLVANVKEAMLGFVLGEETKRIPAGALDTSVSVVVDQSRAGGVGPIVGSVEGEKIPQGVSQFVSVQSAQNGLATGASRLFVGPGEFRGEKFNDGSDVVLLRLGSLAGRHFAEVELIKDALPDFEIFNFGKIVFEGVEAEVSFLFFGAVAVVTMDFEEGLCFLQCIAKKSTRGAEQGQGEESGSHGNQDQALDSRPLSAPVLEPN